MLAELFMGNASLEAGASAKWDNRYLVPGTELDDIAHLLSRLRMTPSPGVRTVSESKPRRDGCTVTPWGTRGILWRNTKGSL